MQAKVWLAVFGLAAIGGERLATDYSTKDGRRVHATLEFQIEVTSMEATRDGEPLQGMSGGMSSESTRTIEHVDRVLEHDESGPKRVRREFVALEIERSTSFGEQSNDETQEGSLAGATLELTRGDDGEVEAKVVDGSEPDEASALEGHRLELALDALLPGDEVDAGGEWELDNDAVRRALALDLHKALFPEKPPEEQPAEGGRERGRFRGRGGPRDASLLLRAEWTGTAKLTDETEEFEGATCAVIELEIEGQGDVPQMGPGGGGGRAFGLAPLAREDNTFEIELEGRLLFDKAKKQPVHLEIDGTISMTTHSEREFGESKMVFHAEYSGEISVEVSVSAVASEDEE
jgi:hypothetical protein